MRVVAKKVTRAATVAPRALTPMALFSIRELDPVRKCGPGTSVASMYRVDEQSGSRRTTHLVFSDRHGWYCDVDGRDCRAVVQAKRHGGRTARRS